MSDTVPDDYQPPIEPMALPATMIHEAKRAYRAGFRVSDACTTSLDDAERKWLSHPQYNDWLDGWLDAANREFGHIPNCRDHDSCP